MKQLLRLATTAVFALILVSCGNDNPADSANPETTVLTPDQASGRTGLAAVQGFLWSDEPDSIQLCSSVLESFPPQCGRPAIEVTGIDITTIAGVDFFENIFWAEGVRVVGVLDDGQLIADRIDFDSSGDGLNARILVPQRIDAPAPSWTILLSNPGDDSVEITFTSGQDADVLLIDEDGQTVYTWSSTLSFTQETRIESLEPGETRRLFLSGVPMDLDSGIYDLEATIVGRPRPGPMTGTIQIS